MGVLYNAVNMKKQMKKQYVLDRLTELGVTHTQQGKPIQECDYETLKYELVLSEFRQIDISHDSNKWF
jgi:hypothetical protein